ncbi:hypothetical protein ACJ72_03701 [Emergomyces africanus]|uniref:JmjC domain-containing protein n=1 Tax=Emergomyces africanus TaxID=1955775 RepID=A0A1B7NYW2_9EURO|nr:hypothetical protein ACJ72_03701 [Emergomyces africanus]
MAPIKRSRVDPHNDPASSAPLSSQLGPRKKARTADVLGARDDSDSDTDTTTSASTTYDSESASEHNGANPDDNLGDPASDPESDLDIGDEEAIERRASQYIQKKFSQNIENVPAEHGIIERVDCYNFMCHEHFSVDLGPLINFIVGKNGSGKSAILTALTLCLGGKASVTNRGQSLKSFIKEGKDAATIVVRIKNQGDSAYNPNEYGNSIIVERHFSRSGASGFKIKSSSGRIVSTKKSELDSITDYFALQIDNPMNVLSQDMARQFLSSSSPSEKYKFFVKGVQLEQLDQDYRLLEESIDQTEAKLSIHLDQIKDLEVNKNNSRAKLALSDKNETMRARVRNLRAQMAWVQVEEQEKQRDACDAQLEEATRKIADLEVEVERADEIYQEADREYNVASQAVRAARSELETQEDRGKGAKENLNETLKERHDLQATQRMIRECLKTAESAIEETQRKIDEEKKRLEDLDGGSHARRLAELEQKRAEAEEAGNQYHSHRRDVDRLQEDIQKAERDLQGKREPVTKQRSDIEQAENRLRSLMRDKGQQQGGFHEKMPMLLRAIEQEQYKFSRKPVGPLGNHIRLLKPKWSGVLESSLGANLSGFVVTTKSDSNTLSDLFSALGPDRPDNRWLIIGPPRSGSTFHKDPNATSAWNAVLRGSKYWIMFPSNAAGTSATGPRTGPGAALPPPPGVYVSADQSEVTSPLSIAEWFLGFHDAARRMHGCIEGICGEGEVLHVPSGWWHLVVNLEEGVDEGCSNDNNNDNKDKNKNNRGGGVIAITQNFVPKGHLVDVLGFLSGKREQVSGFRGGVEDPFGLFVERLKGVEPELVEGALREMEKGKAREREGRKRKWAEVVKGPVGGEGDEAGDGETGEGGGGFSFGFEDDGSDVEVP